MAADPAAAGTGLRHRRRGARGRHAGGQGAEFPAFTACWSKRPAAQAREMHFYALLNSPRITGAYRFVVRPGTDTVLEVQARLFLGEPVAKKLARVLQSLDAAVSSDGNVPIPTRMPSATAGA